MLHLARSTPFGKKKSRNDPKFSHKILLAVRRSGSWPFALFTFYNDYLQRNAIRQNLESSIQQSRNSPPAACRIGSAGGCWYWKASRKTWPIKALPIFRWVDQSAFTSNFQFTYVGSTNGVFTQRPDAKMPDGYDPRQRPWYKQLSQPTRPCFHRPTWLR